MKLRSIEFVQDEGSSRKWRLEGCTFEDINLIVGGNATGKTKVLNVVGSLANLLSRHRKLRYKSGDFKVCFDKNGTNVEYILKYEDTKVVEEKLVFDGDVLMERGDDGIGRIHAEEEGKTIKFQTPEDEVAAFAKRDSIQHKFLDDLYNWADRLIHFYFGTPMGKDTFIALFKSDEEKEPIDLKETNKVVGIFRKGREEYPKQFIPLIEKDMASIGYAIEDMDIGPPFSISFIGPLPSRPLGLIVKESDLGAQTDQHDMSQGMFRALSLLVQINYAQLRGALTSVLIDDIGEGLDYDRSSKLIRLIIEKAQKNSAQLIMATNDRFVMNNAPLSFWTIVHRLGNRTLCLNPRNFKKMFDEFELTGLNNFDLFSSKYFLKHLKEND